MPRTRSVNPFQTLYLTEALTDPELYWHLFSPKIITGEAERLFRVGNVVLLGSNGTGKTMLLKLFSPSVQAAYKRHALPLPLPENTALLSVSINLLHAGFSALGRRRPQLSHNTESSPASDGVLWPLMMGDLLNYAIVAELLETLSLLARDEGSALAKTLRARVAPKNLAAFAEWVAARDCWFGALRGVRDFDGLASAVQERILAYRNFINWNTDHLPADITVSKTEIGVPIAVCRRGLSECGVLDPAVPFMVALDQYESLLHTDYESDPRPGGTLGMQFCRVVNSLLAMRDPTVSYKFGVRPYGWSREGRVFGTDARLEVGRDYQVVNLDEVLRRKESTRSWTFPDFADDVASRRIAAFHKSEQEDYKGWLRKRLEILSPDRELEKYCAKNPARLLPSGEAWPEEWRTLVQEEYKRSKFGAKLAETWIIQTLGKSGRLPRAPAPGAPSSAKPWLRDWWSKERREALKTQIASSCRQRRLYGGWEVLMTLSASNILVFLSLCREIWDTNERTRKDDADTEADDIISADVQSQAIRVVSETWLRKQTEFPGGSKRKDFITRLGIGIRKALLADKGLVYPGHNGFSLVVDEYEAEDAADVREFLENATDFGALISSPHTTKEVDRKPRRKWYLFPILCPNFEIPAVRTKEPYYAALSEVREWLSDARPEVVFRGVRTRRGSSSSERKPRTADGTPRDTSQPDLFINKRDK